MVFPNSKSKREEKAKKELPGIQPGVFDCSLFFSEGFDDVVGGREQLLGRFGHAFVLGVDFNLFEVFFERNLRGLERRPGRARRTPRKD